MSGHSKWSTIKHKKAATDARRGKLFSKLAREIMVAARDGGGDPAANITLRAIIQKARAANMPMDNIERAIKKGTGESGGAALEEIFYEGYVPGGVAVIVQALSDNRNRTTAEVRHVFNRFNASLSGQGSVMRSFQRKGHIIVRTSEADEDRLLELVLEAGAEDFRRGGEHYEITTDPADFSKVVEALNAAGIPMVGCEITLMPETVVPVTDAEKAAALLKFIEMLEELDDVQNVYANFDIDDSLLAQLSGGD